jgi:nucleoside-specific outer membrane channel protein Tsx
MFLSISVGAIAYSTTNIQLLYGSFNGNSYLYDTKNGGKTTFTLEHYSESKVGSIYAFADYAIADDKYKYHNDKTDLYAEVAPRLSLSYLTNSSLSFVFVRDLYLVGEYNTGTLGNYRAYLYGFGASLDVYGFDNFGLNIYEKEQNIGKDTIQLTGFYATQLFNSNFSFSGYFDWTELDFTTQNQLLYQIKELIKHQDIYVGVEIINYHEKPSKGNFYSDVNSNTIEVMIKYKF